MGWLCHVVRFVAASFLLVACSVQEQGQEKAADYIFQGGSVYTVDAHNPWATAVAVRGNAIVYVGDEAGARAFQGADTEMVDASGKMVLPGFIDSHVHPIWGGRGFAEVDVREAKTKKEFQQSLIAFRQENPDAAYIAGGGWIMENFADSPPTKEWIDEVVSDIPVLLIDHFGHSALANSITFDRARVDGETVNPEGGHFVRRDDGTLTGIVREGPAISMVEHLFAGYTPEMDRKALKDALGYLNSNGITSFITAYMVGEPLGETFVDLYQAGELTARTTLSFKVTTEMPIEETLAGMKIRRTELEGIDSSFMRADMAKLFLDGVILSHTAAMLAPYEKGFEHNPYEGYLFSHDRLKDYSLALSEAGFGLHYHTVGDGAAHQALDTVDYVRGKLGPLKKSPTISHLTILDEGDFARFAELGVVANAQLYWGKHQEIITKVEDYIGPKRSQYIFAHGGIPNAGGRMAAGSDWPVSTADPFDAMEISAVRPRTSINATGDDVFKGDVWLPEQKVDVETMIRAFTLEGAKLQSWDHLVGSLTVGKRADLIVVDQNILEVPLSKLHETQVLLTMVDGKVVFEK